MDYSQISLIKSKDNKFGFLKEIKGKYDNITNSGTIELSNTLMETEYKKKYQYIKDIYFVIKIENITFFDIGDIDIDVKVISKDENYILLPINKYIRNSFNLIENKNIIQKYFFEKENLNNNKFILEFSSNYENIEFEFNNLTKNSNSRIIGGFKQYTLSINSDKSSEFYFKIKIKKTNKLNIEKTLKEVNIIIKYYNKEQKMKTDYIWNKNFKLEKINIKGKYTDYNLIISNKNEIKNYPKNFNYIYYLRLVKKKEILKNEELNTIAQISSNLSYINKYNIIEPNKEFSFNLNNLENNEIYIASFFIIVGNENGKEEKYYSMTYEINEINAGSKNLLILIIVIVSIIILIIVLTIIFIYCCKMRNKNRSLSRVVNSISFSSEINDDILNESSDLKKDEDKDNYFI